MYVHSHKGCGEFATGPIRKISPSIPLWFRLKQIQILMKKWTRIMKKANLFWLIIFLSDAFMGTAVTAVTITDYTGTVVTIVSPPQRIVSLSPSNTEILFALGLGDRVAGVTEYCSYPPEALEKPKIGGYRTVSIEKVIALKPDLILASDGNGEEVLENLRSLGYTVVALRPETLAQVLADIQLVGQATGADANATRLVGDLNNRIREVEARVATVKGRPTVAHVIWNDPIYVSGNGTFQDELIKMAGGRNAFSEVEGWRNIGIEDFIRADPDVLIVNTGTGMGGGEDSIAQFFLNEPRFSTVSALRNNRVYLIDTDTVNRASPRIIDALERFAQDIHPSLFGNATSAAIPASETQAPGFGALIALAACTGVALTLKRRAP
jgi:iron complex transport system substrate-binding protein